MVEVGVDAGRTGRPGSLRTPERFRPTGRSGRSRTAPRIQMAWKAIIIVLALAPGECGALGWRRAAAGVVHRMRGAALASCTATR